MFGFKRKTKKNEAQQTTQVPNADNNAAKTAQAAEPAESAQKRNHFRLDCNISAIVKPMKKNELKQLTLGEPRTGLISNLSSGGARLLLNADLDNDERVLLSFKLDSDLIILTGEMKFKSASLNPEYVYQYGIMFTGASTKDQDIICKYLFKEQMQSFL